MTPIGASFDSFILAAACSVVIPFFTIVTFLVFYFKRLQHGVHYKVCHLGDFFCFASCQEDRIVLRGRIVYTLTRKNLVLLLHQRDVWIRFESLVQNLIS